MTALALVAVALLAGNVTALAWRRRQRVRATWALEDAEAGWPSQLQDPPANCAPITRMPIAMSRDMLTTIPADPYAVAYAGIVQAERLEAAAAWDPQASDIRRDLERARTLVAESGAYELTEHWCLFCPSVCQGDAAYWRHLEMAHRDVYTAALADVSEDGGRRGD